MDELKIFEHPDFGEIRALEVEGEPWFVAADVCRVLDIGNPSQAMTRLDEDEKTTLISNEGAREMNFVNEPGLYTLVLGSRKPEAKAFKRWLTHDVIPAIRRQGAYIAPNAPPQALDSTTVQAFTAAIDGLASMVQALALRMDALEQKPALPAPAKPPNNKGRRQWMRTASQMLDKLADECGLPSATVLHNLYQEMETELDISLSEIRLKAIEERQLGDCSFLLAIFYDDTLREWFSGRVNTLLSDKNPFW